MAKAAGDQDRRKTEKQRFLRILGVCAVWDGLIGYRDKVKERAITMAEADWQIRLKTLGRNDECTCGSKKKYKKCCLVADEKKKSEELAATQAAAKAQADKEVAEHKHEHGEECDHEHEHIHDHPHAHVAGHSSDGVVKPHTSQSAAKQVSAPRKVGST
jgi:hypothetical protein